MPQSITSLIYEYEIRLVSNWLIKVDEAITDTDSA